MDGILRFGGAPERGHRLPLSSAKDTPCRPLRAHSAVMRSYNTDERSKQSSGILLNKNTYRQPCRYEGTASSAVCTILPPQVDKPGATERESRGTLEPNLALSAAEARIRCCVGSIENAIRFELYKLVSLRSRMQDQCRGAMVQGRRSTGMVP